VPAVGLLKSDALAMALPLGEAPRARVAVAPGSPEAAAVRLGAANALPPFEPGTAGCTSEGAPRRLTTVPLPSAPSCGIMKLPVCSGGVTDTSIKSPMTTSRPASPPTLLSLRADVRKRIRLEFASGTAIVAGNASPRLAAVPARTPVSSLFRAVDHAMRAGAPSRAAPVAGSAVMGAHITRASTSANARLSAAAQPTYDGETAAPAGGAGAVTIAAATKSTAELAYSWAATVVALPSPPPNAIRMGPCSRPPSLYSS
jgi:hypothetical protein